MGAPALEARLRRRLLVLVAPAIVAVGVASVGVMQHALVAADSETARTRAGDLLRDFRREVSAGDPVDVALDEVVSGAEADGFRFVVRGIPNHPERPSAEPLPAHWPISPTVLARQRPMTMVHTGARAGQKMAHSRPSRP